jgi:signal peptidase I
MSHEIAEEAGVAGREVAAAKPEKQEGASLREYIESLLVTVILALFGTTFVVQAFKIPSQSMEPTLLVGDHLLVNKFIFGGREHWYDAVLPYREVRRGDVIVFKFPYQDHPHYVKRVIGVPGDRIKIVDQQVFLNGQKQKEPYAYHDPAAAYDPFLYNFPPASKDELLFSMQPEWSQQIFQYVHDGEIVVPPGNYFAMGDNRDHSWDSRYWGFVNREAIMGGPVVIYWSVVTAEDDENAQPPSAGAAVKDMFDTLIHLPTRTRWKRMLRTVH